MSSAREESIPGYSSRFEALYQLAYPTDPGAAEEQNALAFYLSGLSDQAVARQVFTKLGNQKTVLNAIKLTKEKAQTYERYDALTSQVRRDRHTKSVTAEVQSDPMEALSLQLKRIDTRLGKIESRSKQHGGTPKQSNKHTAPQARPHKQTDVRRTTDSHSRRTTDSGRTCYRCRRTGHVRATCTAQYHTNRSP